MIWKLMIMMMWWKNELLHVMGVWWNYDVLLTMFLFICTSFWESSHAKMLGTRRELFVGIIAWKLGLIEMGKFRKLKKNKDLRPQLNWRRRTKNQTHFHHLGYNWTSTCFISNVEQSHPYNFQKIPPPHLSKKSFFPLHQQHKMKIALNALENAFIMALSWHCINISIEFIFLCEIFFLFVHSPLCNFS